MILVDIEMPSNGKKYDFRLDENAYIAEIIDEIAAMMISKKDYSEKKLQSLLLCDYAHQRILPLNSTLKQCGIENGDKLFFL